MSEATTNRRGDPDRIVSWLASAGVEGASLIQHVRDSILCEPNDRAELVYFIQRGQVRVHHVGKDQTERFSAILGAGAWVGVAALAEKPKYCIRARVMADSQVWQIPADSMVLAMAKNPAIAATLVTQLAVRLYESYEEATRLVFHNTNRRLLQALIDFSKSPAALQQPEGVTLHITHQELAHAVGAARETVSLALTTLREKNLVKTGRNRLTFDPQALKEFAATQGSRQSAHA